MYDRPRLQQLVDHVQDDENMLGLLEDLHGGIALGLDRIAMLLAGAPSLREVIAFPKTAKAIDLMVDAPTGVTEQQLRELHVRVALKS